MAPKLESMEVLPYVHKDKSAKLTMANLANALMVATYRQRQARPTPPRSARVRSNVMMLIEAHVAPQGADFYFPVEIYPEVFHMIEMATSLGITVIEPAGNGRVPEAPNSEQRTALHLDDITAFWRPDALWKTPPRSLQRVAMGQQWSDPSLSAPADSGAIMVACADRDEMGKRWVRSSCSNYGSRIDCFAAGEDVYTLNANDPQSADTLGGTSAASAIIAGAALCLQGVAIANQGHPLSPKDLRDALRDPELGTKTISDKDKIGVMPNLVPIAMKYASSRE